MSGTLTAADKLRHWRADPAAMVRELFGVAMLFISAAVVAVCSAILLAASAELEAEVAAMAAERRGILEK